MVLLDGFLLWIGDPLYLIPTLRPCIASYIKIVPRLVGLVLEYPKQMLELID